MSDKDCKKCSGGGKTMFGAAFAAAIGALAGLLFAPKPGKQLRKDIAKQAGVMRKNLEKTSSEIQERVHNTFQNVGSSLEQHYSELKAQVLAAIDFYKQFKTSSVLLLETTRMLVDKLMKQMKGLDLDERDDKNKPIFALNTITATIEKVPGLVVKLDEAEKAIASELKSDSKMRGQGEKTIFEDNLEI